jgi:hypothetical protein
MTNTGENGLKIERILIRIARIVLMQSRGAAEFSETVLSVAPAGLGFLVALTRS